MRKKTKILSCAIICLVFMIASSYSAFATNLNINGTSEITGNWNVHIADVSVENVSDGCDAGIPQYTDTSVTFNARLNKPGDSVTYAIKIINEGTIDAKLDRVIYNTSQNSSEDINYESNKPSNILKAGNSDTLTLTITFNPDVRNNSVIKTSELTGAIYYVQAP